MEKQITIDTEKTYTKSEYARVYNISRPKIDEMIKFKELRTIKVKGTTLILAS